MAAAAEALVLASSVPTSSDDTVGVTLGAGYGLRTMGVSLYCMVSVATAGVVWGTEERVETLAKAMVGWWVSGLKVNSGLT